VDVVEVSLVGLMGNLMYWPSWCMMVGILDD
jgi:hypothetical protein